MLFLGDDWAEAHHDVEPQDEHGRVLARRRLPEGVVGLAQLQALIADHLNDHAEPESVLVGIETDRGGWVQALVATGYVVYAMNPLQVARYRERHTTSGANSDPGDAHVLAEIVRVDRGHHRQVAGDSELAEVVRTLARTHQTLIWTRQRHYNGGCLNVEADAAGQDLGDEYSTVPRSRVLINHRLSRRGWDRTG